MQPLSWAYVVGFFDGEGCVSTYYNKGRRAGETRVHINQSGDRGRELLIEIEGFLEERGIRSNITVSHPRRGRTVWALQISSRGSVKGFLQAVRPYVRMKKQIVEDTLRFFTAFPPVPKGYVFRELNRSRAKFSADEALARIKAGSTAKALAAEYGVTEWSIRNRLRRGGFSFRKYQASRR